ncbi:MAG: phage shock protein E [Chlamydiales bacterium]|jgi:phage shock protein E
MDLEKIREELAQNAAILLDVREKDEWDDGHLKNATFLPLSTLKSHEIPGDLPKDKTIYIYCRMGPRAQRAAEILKEVYPNAVPLSIGFNDLMYADFPVE